MRTFFILLLTLLIATGCKVPAKRQSRITVHNQSPRLIDSLHVSSYGLHVSFTDVQPNEQAHKDFTINGRKEPAAGAFVLTIHTKDTTCTQSFGYFSHVTDIKPSYKVVIGADYKIKESPF